MYRTPSMMVNQCRRRHNTKRKHGGSYNVSYIPSWVTAHISLSRYLDIAGNLTTLKASLRSGSQYVKDLNCSPTGNRNRNLLLRRKTLYPLSYGAWLLAVHIRYKSGLAKHPFPAFMSVRYFLYVFPQISDG